MNNLKSSNLLKYFVELGKMSVVYIVIFQLFTQPIAVLAQSRNVLEIPRVRAAAKSNIKPKAEAEISEGFLPDVEKRARKAVSDTFGVNIPLPQVFGENGKLQALFSGGSSSADKNKELIDAALNNGKANNSKSNTKRSEKTSNETAISLNAPILNRGLITGSLRVAKEVPFNVGSDFRITENLYAAGSPNISSSQNSDIRGVVNEESDDLSKNYPLFLSGGRIDGNIHIHSTAENIFKDIPLGLPQPTGSEAVAINSADDLKNIKDWKAVRNLTINAAGLTIPIPAGNYESIALNAANKLVFADGDYNFSDTIYLAKGSSIQIVGKTTIGIAKNLVVDDVSIKTGETVLTEAVKINVLGSSVVLSGKSEIEGFLRATGANVILNENSKITGQVIAGSLVMNGGTVAESASEPGNRVFGLKQYNRTSGAPNNFTDNFARNDCQAPYLLKIYNGGPDGSNRVSSATVKLNGATVVAQNAFNQNIGYIERAVNLKAANKLEVRLSSSPGSFFNLEITGTNCGTTDTTAPVLAISSPQNNSTTTASAIAIQGTASDDVGISQVLVNNTQATFNASNNSWNLPNFPLNLGVNQIDVTAIDNAGNQSTQTITITRQPAVVDVTPPALAISSPADNATVEAQTITVTGTATDAEANASGLASVTVNGQNVNLSLDGSWTISDVALNIGSNTITARAVDNAGNISTDTITVIRQETDTTPPTLAITAPGNNSETTNASVAVSGTVTDSGENPSGVASVTVNGQSATISGNSWTIENVSLSLGANTIIANAIDNAGNSSSQQITVTRGEPDTAPPTIVINSPANDFETIDAAINISGTATDLGANASGVQGVTVNGQNANFTGGNWSFDNVPLNIGGNTITVKAIDAAGNEATSTVTGIRREPDTQAPAVTISAPVNNSETISETITVQGTVTDNGANASGIQSVIVNGVSAVVNGSNWTAENLSLSIGSNTLTAIARDNNNNTGSASVVVVRNPPDTQAPALVITTPANNFETFDAQTIVSGTVSDSGAGATGVQSVTVNGVPANYAPGANSWTATVNLNDGVNVISVVATDNAPVPNHAQASVQVTKVVVQPPTLTVTNPQNGAFLSANSVTIAGTVASNKPDMTFAVTVNGEAANLAGREFTKTFTLSDGANAINVVATDALGQQAQQSITVTNDRTPPTVFLANVPQVVNPGESYTIGALASDAYGIADVEFTVDGASVTRSAVSPYQFTLNVPPDQVPNQNLNISAIARDNAGLSATATARVVTSGPSGLTGYVFDDATGYVLPLAFAKLNGQAAVPTDANGLYSFVSTSATGNILLTKEGYTSVERGYSATAGSGVEVFDARLTPLDSKVNTADVNGSVAAADSANKIQVQFAPASFPAGTDVRITPVSPQGLASLLPFGWSPIPDAVVDIRGSDETQFSNRNFSSPASLTIPQIAGLPSNVPVVLARYDSATHAWMVVQKDLAAGANGSLQANLAASGQYAFLVADTGATAPAVPVVGENLPAAAPANSEQLDAASATAAASPATALYSSTAKSRISFVANSATKLPSGISIEASFSDSYLTIIDRNFIAIDRPSQDFVLYAFPAVSATEPNKLGAYFVAKPIRTDFGLTDLLNAKVHVDVRSGRLSQTGILIGQSGGVVRGAEGSQLEIPGGAVNNPQVVFFNKISNDQAGVGLPAGYEIVGVFDVNLAGNTLTQSAKISMPAGLGDNSKIVAAKVISIAGQPGLKVVGRVTENNSRLESGISQPEVPGGVNLSGIRDGGKYVFVRMPSAFGYVQGTVSSAVQNTQAVKIANTQTPFVDLTGNNGVYTILGLANGENNQVDAFSLNNDATGFAVTSLAAQDAVANLPISLAAAVLSVLAVTPTNAATGVMVTAPVTVTFNKPILSSTVTGSNIKLVTASGNPVITTLTTLSGGRSVSLTPTSNLQAGTDYKVQVSTNIRDLYGNSLASAFESTFRTANPVTVGGQLQSSQIRISYPNEQGFATISIPAGAVPSGSTIFAINNATGATVSTVAGSSAIELLIQARVGDEIELIIRQPDGAEYRLKQAAYRRADGFVSVGSNGGTITSEDGSLVLQVPAGAIVGQANVRMVFAAESEITAPREGEMAPGEMAYLGGVKIEAQGNFTNTEELHLELPAPANAPEGQRALVMKPTKVNYNGNEIDAWETITSAKIENGKIKTTSPPFIGVTLVSALVAVAALSFWVFVPMRQRVVTGVASKRQSDNSLLPVGGATCSIPTPNAPQPRVYARTDARGKFALSHNNSIFPDSENVEVLCGQGGISATALAYPYAATQSDWGIFGFTSRFATVIFPPDSPVNLPPQITVDARMRDLEDGQIDTLRETGKVVVNSSIAVKVKVTPLVESFTGDLFINGSLVTQLEWERSQEGTTRYYETIIHATTPGSYGISIKAQTVASQANTRNTATYNFIALADPNNCLSNPSSPPVVLTDSSLPRQGALQVDVGTKIHLEFSEPVKGFSPGSNLYLTEMETGEIIGGTVTSGGLPVGENTLKCQIDFTPARRLKGGKEYKITLKDTVKDDDDRKLTEEFNRTFTTFQGSVITPEPIPDNSNRITTLDDYIITAEITASGTLANGLLKIYDFSTIFGAVPSFEYKTPIGTAFISHRPIALTAFTDEFPSLGGGQKNIVAVTTTAVPDTTRPNNLWFYDITVPENPELVGVVSLSIPDMRTEIPVSVTVHKKRAYIGNISFGGALVVDIERALQMFQEEVTSVPPDQRQEAINRVRVRAIFPQQGFGQEARIQRGVYAAGPGQPSPVKGISVITQNLDSTISPIAYILSTNLPKLISFDFNNANDGLLDFSDRNADSRDDRWLLSKDLLPSHYLQDLQAVSGFQLGGTTKDLVVAISPSNFYIFDVTDPKPSEEPVNPKQYPAKSFVSLGLAETDQALKVELEDTLAYVLFPDKVAVIDISDPNNPYLSTVISGLGSGLRWMAVKNGLVYTIGQSGVHVSVGRGLVQMVAYGIDPSEPARICGNPVVIKSETNEMAQPAGFYFQAFGHDRPTSSKIIIREVTLENNSRFESVIETIRDVEVFQTVANNITAGRAQLSPRVIDPSKIYTAEVVLDEGSGTELRSKQIEIPFSQLITNFPNRIALDKNEAFGEVNQTRAERTGKLIYGLAGPVVNVTFEIDATPYALFENLKRPEPTMKNNKRPFGVILDYMKTPLTVTPGRHTFKYTATLKGTNVTEIREGELIVGENPKDLRLPGSMVVAGVEVGNGNLALSDNDLRIPGRGLSLEFNRSYNSQASDVFGPIGYGWRHNYQITLQQSSAEDNGTGRVYYLNGGEGGTQKFDEANLQNGIIKAGAPHFGILQKNSDGTFDYFTKSRIRYHFRSALSNNAINAYLGNVVYIEEPNGNRLSFEYDTFGRLRAVKDSSNRKLNFDYELATTDFAEFQLEERTDPECPTYRQYQRIASRIGQSQLSKKWRITRIHDESGLAADYTYDDNGNLQRVSRNADDEVNGITRNRVSGYEYNPLGTNRFPHLLKSVQSPNNLFGGAKTTYSYQITASGIPLVNAIALPETVNNAFSYEFNPAGKVTKATYTDGNSNQTVYELPDGKYVTSISAPNSAVTTLEWTIYGQITRTIDPEGMTTSIGYDLNNNPISQTISGGGKTISTVTTFEPKFSKMTSFTDGNNNTTTYAVNGSTGNIDEIRLPTGRSIIFRFAANGDLLEMTDQFGTLTKFSGYDAYGNPQTITKFLAGGQTQTITQSFDSRSRQRSINDSLGVNVVIDYDNLDRPARKITNDPAGFRETLTEKTSYRPEGELESQTISGGSQSYSLINNYDDLGRLKKTTETVSGYGNFERDFTYDRNSNLLTEENRRGIVTERTYNGLNHLTRIRQGNKTVWDATGFGGVDRVGNPREVVDLYGNKTTYVYDGLHRLIEKQLPEDLTEKLEYDNNNNITASYDRNENRTGFRYDPANRVSEVQDALGRITKWTYTDAEHKITKEFVARRLTETTVLDGLDRPVLEEVVFGNNNYATVYEYNGRTVNITDPRGTVIKNDLSGYGEVGRTEVVGANPAYKIEKRYSAFGALRQLTDALNRVTSFTNDGFNRPRTINYDGRFSESRIYDGEGLLVEFTDRRGVTTSRTYDDLGRETLTRTDKLAPETGFVTTQIAYDDGGSSETLTDGNFHSTVLEYDGLRRVKKVTNAGGKIKTLKYDGENLREESDFYNDESRRTKFVYDALNRVREVFDRKNGHTKIDYSDDDLVKTTTDRRGNLTTENYDALGRLMSVGSYGKVVGLTYDGNNNRVTQEDGLNNQTVFTYDKLNRLSTVAHPGGLQTEIFTYDAAGNVKTHKDGRGDVVRDAKYDALNQLTELTDGENQTTKFEFDGAGLLLSKTEPKGDAYRTIYTYNAFGSLTSVTDANSKTWNYEYDNAQNLRFVKDALYNAGLYPDDNERVTEYRYDNLNRLTEAIQPKNRVTTYGYDNNSNLTSMTDPKNQTVTMNYDALDRLDDASYTSGGQQQLYHDFKYDAEDNLYEVTENRAGFGTRSYRREYDTRNRLTSASDAFNKSVRLTYDTANNLRTLTDAANRVSTYSYDAKNQLDKVVQNGTELADYDWFADGLLQKVTYSNGTNRNYAYDHADRVTGVTNNFGNNQNETFTYVYDANSNRISEIRKANGRAFRTISFNYDKLDRLTGADYISNVSMPSPPAGSQAVYFENTDLNTYGYDAVGNRINETNKVQTKTVTLTTNAEGVTTSSEQTTTTPEDATTASFDSLNQLTQLNEPSGITAFDYDNNGNLTEIRKITTVISKFEYDVRNQLTKAKDGLNNELARFDYDVERKRISKSNAQAATNYVYAGSRVVNEYQNNAVSASYAIGAGEIVRSEFTGGENSFHYMDALGSVTNLADAGGAITTRNEYNAFGEIAVTNYNPNPTGSGSNSIGFTGQRLDNETGLMALGNGERYYSPSYARFIQQDSYAGSPNEPPSLNRYSYAHNNPNKYTDPSGNVVFALVLIPFLIGVAISVIQQDQEIRSGVRKQEDFSMSEAAVNHTVIGTTFRAATGTDAVSGQKLTGAERALAIGETLLEFTSIAGNSVKVLAKSAKVASAAKVLGNASEVTQAAIGIYRGGDATIDLVKRGEFGYAALTGILTAFGAYGGAKAYKGLKAELPQWKLFPPGVGIDGVGLPSVKFVGNKGNAGFDDIGEQILSPTSANAAKIDDRLQGRLDAWKRYRSNGGEMEMKRWVQATQGSYGNPNRFGEGYGKWIRNQEKGIHGNSLDAIGPHDLYVIRQRGTDQIVHFGETGRGFRTRGKEWVAKLKAEYGLDTYFQHLGTVEGKRAARRWETKRIRTYEKLFGHKPGFTDENGNFIQIQRTEH